MFCFHMCFYKLIFCFTILQTITISFADTIQTSFYGTDGGNNVDPTAYINQGIITGIASWGINTGLWSGRLGNFSWITGYDQQTRVISDNFGYYNHYEYPCQPFKLNPGDSINGYRVLYPDGVCGITFHTKEGNQYSCIHSSCDGSTDTGDIYYNPNYYLSGFYITAYAIVDGIGFQFTKYTTPDPTGTEFIISLFVNITRYSVTRYMFAKKMNRYIYSASN